MSTLTDSYALNAYIRDIGRYPLLEHTEQIEVFKKYCDATVPKSKREELKQFLINSNLRLVVSIAKRYKHYGVPMIDLIQEGNVGLMTGIEKFNPTLGWRLSTYASYWIKQAIRRYITDTKRTVRLPSHIAALLPILRAAEAKILDAEGIMPSPERLAVELGCTVDAVLATRGATGGMVSASHMASPVESSGHNSRLEVKMHDSLEAAGMSIDDPDVHVMNMQLKEIITRAFTHLTPREEQVIRFRFGIIDDPDDVDRWPPIAGRTQHVTADGKKGR